MMPAKESVRLFVERAEAARPDFALTAENAESIAEICVRLEGIPLAIELAAALVKHLAPQEISQRLGKALPLLVGGPRDLPARQRTLRDAISWSYDLLDEPEQKLFRCLSVFTGGSTVEAAAIVCELGELGKEGNSPLGRLEALANKSLLWRDVRLDVRFGMLETIREYAGEQLEAKGEAAWVRRLYMDYFQGIAQEAHPRLLKGSDQELWLQRLETEHANLRSALKLALEIGDGEAAVQMGATMWKFWLTHDHVTEGRWWLEQALRQPEGGGPPNICTGSGAQRGGQPGAQLR